jgi:accessory colonization factor AcfC
LISKGENPMTSNRYRVAVVLVLFALLALPAAGIAEDVLYLYGPGGPAPAMKEAAEVFGKANNVRLEVTAGPTGQWLAKAKADADLIFSGSEYMMTDFIVAMEGRIDVATVTPLYLRPSAILVRPGNPKRIGHFTDLLKAGTKVLVVQGAGQAGLWEDVAGRQGSMETVRAFRKNIVAYAANSAEAKKTWTEKPEIDAWLIWNIWQVANPTIADLVSMGPDYAIYRDCGIAITEKGKKGPLARKFVDFLMSKEGGGIFAKWGWIVPGAGVSATVR